MPHLEVTEVVLIHFNIVNNDYQQDPTVLYTFVTNKSFEVWFIDENSKRLWIFVFC